MTDKIYYELWSKEFAIGQEHVLLSSYNFRFLLAAARHQYRFTQLNRLYISKRNYVKWEKNIEPNTWWFFLDFSGKSKPQWKVDGIIDMVRPICPRHDNPIRMISMEHLINMTYAVKIADLGISEEQMNKLRERLFLILESLEEKL